MGSLTTEGITTISPYSSLDGLYPLAAFNQTELATLAKQAQEILNEDEWIIPMIPESIIKAAIAWYAQVFLDEVISQGGLPTTDFSLEQFQSAASMHAVTFNLNGAKWFKEEFEQACLAILQERFPGLKSLDQANLLINPIKVTSSSGLMSFGRANVKVWNPDLVAGKHVTSLDDIGDRGVTQETIRQLSQEAGALSFTSANLVEKMVPNNVSKEKRKQFSPDLALLLIPFFFVLGWGLDEGTREETRDFSSVVILSRELPQTAQIFFQGGINNPMW